MPSNTRLSDSNLKNVASSVVGAPSQFKQGSRKGKRSWRKNVDIQEVEEGLEELRTEERVTGSILQNKRDQDLFQIDLKGDDQVRRSLPRSFKLQLTSTKILSQRSAVPAVRSRVAPSPKPTLTREQKARLLRIAKRPRRGPFNAILEPEANVAELTEAAKQSGKYDLWNDKAVDAADDGDDFEGVRQPNVKPPAVPLLCSLIDIPHVPKPHEGMSYNPPTNAHQELLLKAHLIEEKRLKEEQQLAEVKARMERAEAVEDVEGVPPGMTVDTMDEAADVDQGVEGEAIPKPLPKRKTRQQKARAARLLAEKRALAARIEKKRLLASLSTVKSLKRNAERNILLREQVRAARELAETEALKRGLAGRKVGRHKVPEGDVAFQLGEDLNESLRELKPEGNLFRDRLISLQHRALVEPRSLILGRRLKGGKEFEKHAWKRFDREQ